MSKMGSENHLKSQLDSVSRERDKLKFSLEALEKENKELKQSLYELSLMLSTQGGGGNSNALSLDRPQYSYNALTDSNIKPIDEISDTDRRLSQEAKLTGHTAAVYATSFSPCGNFLASSGFDRSIRLWESTYPFTQVANFLEHGQLVSDVCWSSDTRLLLSCSYDQTVALWDVETGRRVNNILKLKGLIQCVQFGVTSYENMDSSLDDSSVAYAGSTSQNLYVIDLRDPLQSVSSWKTSAYINSLHVSENGNQVIVGDSFGSLVTWDTRIGRELDVTLVEANAPISHICVAPPDAGRSLDMNRIFAVNCYDNTLRVFCREKNSFSPMDPPSAHNVPSCSSSNVNINLSSTSSMNTNMSSNANITIFSNTTPKEHIADIGAHSQSDGVRLLSAGVSSASSRTSRGESVSTVSTSASVSPSRHLRKELDYRSNSTATSSSSQFIFQPIHTFRGHTVKNWPIRTSFFKGMQHRTPRIRRGTQQAPGGRLIDGIGGGAMYEDSGKDWGHSLVLATGSACGNIFTFDLSKNEGSELQILQGHSDRVYSVNFHPHKPLLASGSADTTIRIWGPSKSNKRNSKYK